VPPASLELEEPASVPESVESDVESLSVADVSSVVEVVASVELVADVTSEFAELSPVPAVESSVESEVSSVVAELSSAAVEVSSVVAEELSVVVVVAVVAVTGVAAVLCEVSSARASPGSARANMAASATMAGTIQPWIRFRRSEVMAFRSFDEGSIHDLHSGRSPSTKAVSATARNT
jgi:hypothetical protein